MTPETATGSVHAPPASPPQAPASTVPPISPWVAWSLAAFVAGLLYLATSIPGLAWGDSGNAQLRVLLGHIFDRQDLSRSHVLYYLIAGLVTKLGIEPANAANLVTAVMGAITVGNVAALLALLVRKRVSVYCGAALLLFSHALWRQSTVAEVMTLSTALLSLELLLVVQFARRAQPGWLIAVLFVNGLGLSTHNLAMLTWPAYAVMLVAARPVGFKLRVTTLALAMTALLVGASPLIGLAVDAWSRTGNLGHVLVELVAGRFSANVFNTSVTMNTFVRVIGYTLYSFPTPLIFLGVLGFNPRRQTTTPAFGVFFVVAFAVHFLFAVRYNVPDQNTFMIHTYVFAVVIAALGVDRFVESRSSRVITATLVLLASVAPIVYATVPELLRTRRPDFPLISRRSVPHRDRFDWFLKPWQCDNRGADEFAHEVLRDAPPNAVLVIDSTLSPPIYYVQSRDGLRHDVQIVGPTAYQPWWPTAFDLDSTAARAAAIRSGRLFTATDERRYINGLIRGGRYTYRPHGVLFQVVDTAANDSNSP